MGSTKSIHTHTHTQHIIHDQQHSGIYSRFSFRKRTEDYIKNVELLSYLFAVGNARLPVKSYDKICTMEKK